MLKYKKKLDEFKIENLDDENLDPGFVAKAKDFEDKIEKGTLTDEEISTIDNELCELFESEHDFEKVPDEKTTQLQTQNTILQGKMAADKAESLEELQAVSGKYNNFPEVMEVVNQKTEQLNAKIAQEDEQASAKEKILSEINAATTIDSLKETSKDYDTSRPWIVEAVNNRATEINALIKTQAENQNTEIQTKLLSKKEWNYPQLKEMGITPTGDNMVAHGIKLYRKYLFLMYIVGGKE